MYVTESSFEILSPEHLETTGRQQLYEAIERAARTCYKSEGKMADGSAAKMVKSLVARGHEAMLEHAVISVRFTMDRGMSHELVRHRMAAYAQESTRWCNYSNDKFDHNCTFVLPFDAIETPQKGKSEDHTKEIVQEWTKACRDAEDHYFRLLELGAPPEIARAALNNSTKTEIVVTANAREWRHILKLRGTNTVGRPHPQMLALFHELLQKFASAMPELFGDLLAEEEEGQET